MPGSQIDCTYSVGLKRKSQTEPEVVHLFNFKDSAGLEVLFARERKRGGAFTRGYSKFL